MQIEYASFNTVNYISQKLQVKEELVLLGIKLELVTPRT